MLVRRATKDDRQAIFTMASELAMSFTVTEDDFNNGFEALLSEMANKRAELLIAEIDGEPAGYALGYAHQPFYANGKVGWLEELFVNPEHRAAGLGKLLLKTFEDRMRDKGVKLNALATRRAADFYKHNNYEESAVYFRKVLA